jgi:hypothetical protein
VFARSAVTALALALPASAFDASGAAARPLTNGPPAIGTARQAPKVAEVKPSDGPVAGGRTVKITGSGFVTTAAGSTEGAEAFTYVSPPPAKEGESPPSPGGKEESPPPPAAATCTMTPILLTIQRKHKAKRRPIAAGQLKVTVTCTQGATVTLAGRLTTPVGEKRKDGRQRLKVYRLGPSIVTVAPSVAFMVPVKLPLNTVVALVAKAKESVRITLDATSAGGSSHNAASIKQLKL